MMAYLRWLGKEPLVFVIELAHKYYNRRERGRRERLILIIFNYNRMSKYLRMLGQGIKYSLYLGGATLTGSALYLQYVNSQLGSIDIDREAMTKYYSEHSKEFNVNEREARNMYYWLLIDISIMRVLTYSAYSTSCNKINRRIVDQTLKNYQDRNIIKEI
jgi:hypothetical protein